MKYKKMILAGLFLSCMLFTTACNGQKQIEDLYWTDPPTSADTLYQNPIFEPDLADPSFIRSADENGEKWFYAYGTENTWAEGVHRITPIVRSKDLIKWEYIGDAFTPQSRPKWHDGGIWAPQISFNSNDGMYYLYYSNSKWGDDNPGIGVARSKFPYGPFEDLGKVLDAKSSGVGNSIDQFYIQTGEGRNRKSYLFWGSFRGLYGQEINSTDMKTLIGEKFKIGGNMFEGVYIYPHGGKFWLFASSGNCCEGVNSKYRLSVACADNIRGPYKTKEGKNIIDDWVEGTPFLTGDASKGWVGPGHNAEIIKDDKGRYFILYHAISVTNPLLHGGATRRPLMIDQINWQEDGWPEIEGGTPSNTQKAAPYFSNK